MNRLLQLKQDKAAALDQAEAVLAKLAAEKRTAMSSEEQVAFSDSEKRAKEIQVLIDAEDRLGALAPQGNIPTDRPRGAALVHENWRDKEILFGHAAEGPETRSQRQARLAIGFGEQLRTVQRAEEAAKGNRLYDPDPRLLELHNRAEKRAAAAGASEAVPADGGFLIQPDFSEEILMTAHDTGLVFPDCRTVPLSEFTNSIKIPGIAESSRVDGSRWGGVQMYWENEADALKGTKPGTRQVELITRKLTGLYYATNELLADARALGSIVMQAFGEETGFKLDDGVIRGSGAGQMQGILNADALVSVAKETGQAAGTIVVENTDKMYARLWPRSRKKAKWYYNVDTLPQLMGLVRRVGTAGIPAYMPANGVAGVPYETLYGLPMQAIEQCDTVGTVGDLILADVNQYLMLDKGGLQTAVSMHVRFLTDEQTFRWIYRTDGASAWFKPLTPYKGTNTLSPFVALATRA